MVLSVGKRNVKIPRIFVSLIKVTLASHRTTAPITSPHKTFGVFEHDPVIESQLVVRHTTLVCI